MLVKCQQSQVAEWTALL